ncbi:MAG: hypothetical protein A4E50_00782 [Methanosaeta sp. PtaB.Bin087]|nr:MAG: hypothetical protein A4E50_00782 [Methanosaeta sp. PtaB.Bin087]
MQRLRPGPGDGRAPMVAALQRRRDRRPQRTCRRLGEGLRSKRPLQRHRPRRRDRGGGLDDEALRGRHHGYRHPALRLRRPRLRLHRSGDRGRLLRSGGDRGDQRPGCRDRRGRLELLHRRLARSLGPPGDQQRRRSLVSPRRRRRYRDHLLGDRKPGSLPRHRGVAERDEQARAEPLHRQHRRPRSRDGGDDLVLPGPPPRPLRPRLPELADPGGAGRRGDEPEDRHRCGKIGEGLRLQPELRGGPLVCGRRGVRRCRSAGRAAERDDPDISRSPRRG